MDGKTQNVIEMPAETPSHAGDGGTSPAPLRVAWIGIIRAYAGELDAASAAQTAARRISGTRAPAVPETLSMWALGNVFAPSFFSFASAALRTPAVQRP